MGAEREAVEIQGDRFKNAVGVRPAMRRLFEPVALKMYAACAGVPTSNLGCGAEIWTFRDTARARSLPPSFPVRMAIDGELKEDAKACPVFSVNVTTS
jgi:hypothetical protein